MTSSWQGNGSPGAQHPPAALTQTHEAVKALQAPLHPVPARKGLRHPGAQHIFGDPRYSHQLTVRSQPCSSASGPRPCPNPSRWRRTSAGAGGRCRGPGEGPGRPAGARRTARTALGTAGVCWFVRGWTGLIPVGPHWAALGWTGLCSPPDWGGFLDPVLLAGAGPVAQAELGDERRVLGVKQVSTRCWRNPLIPGGLCNSTCACVTVISA